MTEVSEALHFQEPRTAPWVVLDSTVLSGRDPRLESAAAHTLRDLSAAGSIRVAIPEVVLIEATENHRRAVRQLQDKYRSVSRELKRLGAPQSSEDTRPHHRLRTYLEHLLADVSGEVLPIPNTDHESLVRKAAERRRPFDEHGDGYRDALVWETVLELLDRVGDPVILVSGDRPAFSEGRDRAELAAELARELSERRHDGRVRLVFDLGAAVDEIPQAAQLEERWPHPIAADPELRPALIQALLEAAYEQGGELLEATCAPGSRNPRFANFSAPRNLRIVQSWTSETGSVLLDVELEVDYTIETETLLPGPEPIAGVAPLQWTHTRISAGPLVLAFEAIQQPATAEPSFSVRLVELRPPEG